MSERTFLVELGTEELPPKALRQLATAFADGIAEGVGNLGLPHGAVTWFATPRRLSVQIADLADVAPPQTIEALGPPADRARDEDGNWTPAATGFARKHSVDPSELETSETPKGLRLVFRSTADGAAASTGMPGVVENAISKLPIPKRMRWGASRTEFVRPVHWLVMLHGTDIISCNLLGMDADRLTHGHRFHCNRALSLEHADDYLEVLEKKGMVIADYTRRRSEIADQVTAAGQNAGGIAVIADNLLDEVTGLVEWPVALTGRFEESFLEVPAAALISSMKEHQKYFHVIDNNDKLMPAFITVSNIESSDPQQVIDGNERVIRPRLSDAAFFFNTDLRTPLADRVEQLRTVVFQQKLGTLFDKSQRIGALAGILAPALGADSRLAQRAGTLAKADLVSDMVFEFGDMQGIAGFHYAQHDGEAADVCQAMIDQYLPGFAGDELPSSTVGAAVALADRLDTLTGIFGIGQAPTGSRDPFALRRASVGVLRILIEMEIPLDLSDIVSSALAGFHGTDLAPTTCEDVVDYVLERLRARYQDQGLATEIYMAVAAKQLTEPLDIDRRVQAVAVFSHSETADSLAAANKRVANILEKSIKDESPIISVQEDLLSEPAEIALFQAINALTAEIAPLLTDKNYAAALSALSKLRPTVDQFFDAVMVMVDEADLRGNRVALLNDLRALFLEIADISLLVPSK